MSDEKPIISHSEVTSFGECDLQHWLAYILNLRPYKISEPLQYGIFGHQILEAHYTVLKNGGSYHDGVDAAFKKIKELEKEMSVDVASTLTVHMMKYFMKYKDELQWRLIEVEKTLILELPDKPYDFGFKADLVVEILSGRNKGKHAIVDHKFTYNFWSRANLKQYVQIPRYAWALRKLGYQIDLGIIAQIRYRTNGIDLFKHEDVELPDARVENAFKSFLKKADKVYERRQLTNQEALDETDPIYSTLVCKYCDFNEVCDMRLNGKSIKNELKANFVKSDYGYHR